MRQFSEYIDELCREHALIKHTDEECHFSDLTSDFENRLKRKMNFPCVSLDTDGFTIKGEPGSRKINDFFNLYFLDHVKDTGNYTELATVFARTRTIMLDFLRRMVRDYRDIIDPMESFDIVGAEATRVEFKDAGLYGWVVSVLVPTAFNHQRCNDNFKR